MVTVSCLFGHGTSDDIAISENGFTGRRCPTCAVIYLSPRPGADEVFDLYSHDRAHLPAAQHLAHHKAATLMARHHLRFVRRVVPPQRPDGRRPALLEIGAGAGAFLTEARAVGYDVHGIELNPHQAAHIRAAGIPCETEPFSPASFDGRRFDVIYHTDVLSHLPDPLADLRLMRNRLAAGGAMVFETGNGADIERRFYGFIPVWQYPDHLYFFGRASLRELLDRAGFTDVRIHAWSILPQLALMRAARRRAVSAVPSTSGAPSRPPWKRTAAAYVMHGLRYGVGRWIRVRGAPETLLVVAC